MSSSALIVRVNCKPGLESLLRAELEHIEPNLNFVDKQSQQQQQTGGLTVACSHDLLFQFCLRLRIADSLRVRLAKPFEASDVGRLYARLTRLPFHVVFPALGDGDSPVLPNVRVVTRESKLFHTAAVTETVLKALTGHKGPFARAPDSVEDAGVAANGDARPALDLHVMLDRDLVTVSVDCGGDLLHKRGYKTASGKAPLRETIAAALVRAVENDGPLFDGRRIVDPFAGSGTIVLEAALRQAERDGLATLCARSFALERFRTHDAAAFAALKARLNCVTSLAPAAFAHVLAGDRDRATLRRAAQNAKQLGLGDARRLASSFVHAPFEAVRASAPAAHARTHDRGRRCRACATTPSKLY